MCVCLFVITLDELLIMINQEHRAVMSEFQKAVVESNKTVQHEHEHEHVMDHHFPFFGEQSAGSIVTHLHPILQLGQPNVQDS